MILSRLTRALREQNWLAVVLEFVIVLAGVLLAFQISSWSQSASDRAFTRDILTRLHGELIGLEAARALSLHDRTQRVRDLIEARPIVMGVVDAEALTQQQCVAIAVSDTGSGSVPDALPSLDELMTSGAMESIRSADVRQSAMELYAKRTAVRAYAQESVHEVVNLPIAYPNVVHRTLIPDPNESDDGWDVSASCNLAEMRASPGFQAAMLQNISAYRSHVDFVYGFLDEAIGALKNDLAEELDLNAEPRP